MLFFREGSIDKGDTDSQGTLLRKYVLLKC